MTNPLDIARLTEKKINAVLWSLVSVKAHSTFRAWNFLPTSIWWEPDGSFFPTFVTRDREDYTFTAFEYLWEHVNHIQTGVV